jgi:hypothetical protein
LLTILFSRTRPASKQKTPNPNYLNPNDTPRYDSLSYFEALIKPSALAARGANVRRGPIYFAMQAEMGATLFY